MIFKFRTSVLAAGAAALIAAQPLYAAPAQIAPSVDPLVSLSVLGTAQSRAAVCAAGTAATAGAAATQAAPPGCVLPVTALPPAPVAQTVAPPVAPLAAGPGKEIGMLPILGGLAVLAAIAAFFLLDDDDDDELEPISPA